MTSTTARELAATMTCRVCGDDGITAAEAQSSAELAEVASVVEHGVCATCRACNWCDGCQDTPADDSQFYRVTTHDGESLDVLYCPACADLARADWNGETANIEVMPR